MTEREAIHKLITFRRILEKGVFPVGYRFDAEPFDMAVEALEKQETAKIVIGKSKGGVTLWNECGKCGEPIDAKDIFCRRCGRKLIPLSEPYTDTEEES